jgi:hypothetical protein
VDNPLLTILVHSSDGQISTFNVQSSRFNLSARVRVAAQGGGDDMDRPIENILGNKPKSGTCGPVSSYNIAGPANGALWSGRIYGVMEQMKGNR